MAHRAKRLIADGSQERGSEDWRQERIAQRAERGAQGGREEQTPKPKSFDRIDRIGRIFCLSGRKAKRFHLFFKRDKNNQGVYRQVGYY